jgi:phage tail-like protein
VRTLTSDSRLEADRVDALPDDAWSAPLAVGADDPPEVLVQSSGGRWLWLRVELFGDGTVTPRLTGLDVHGPRRSSVRHLPAAYHSDPESLRFLDRFLSCFDTVFAEVAAEHREVAALLDPWAVPDGEALSWLGGWFDLHFLAEWSPQVRRRMVEEAVASARERGTVAGLRRLVQRHTGLSDPLPQVVEHFRLPEGDAPPVGGAPLDAPRAAHTCTVVLPEAVVPDEAARARLARLLADSAPGHVRVLLRVVPARIAVGHQSTVGVDTLLGRSDPGALGEGRLGEDLALAAPRPSGLVPELPRTSPRRTPC